MSSSRDSAWMGLGIVAEKNSVCRRGGRCFSTRRMSGRKPMSSIRSASSSTSTSRPDSDGVRLLEVVEQPSGRGDDDVHAAAEGVLLRAHPHAAEHRRARQRRVHRELPQVLLDLRRELTRRRQHERPRHAARLVHQPVQDGQEERRGLAAPRHRAGEQVSSLERGRDRLLLDGSGAGEPELLDTPRSRSGWSLNLANGIGDGLVIVIGRRAQVSPPTAARAPGRSCYSSTATS